MFSIRMICSLPKLSGYRRTSPFEKHHLHLFTTRGKQLDEQRVFAIYLVKSRKINGLFVLSPLDADAIRFFLDERLPCVCIGNNYPGLRGAGGAV